MQKNLNNRIEKRVSSLILFLCSNLLIPDEVWREIPGYDGDYFASDKGRILSLCRNEPRILKPFICSNEGNRTGYYYVEIRGQKQRVHRLVALAFLENPEDKPVVHHIDGNPLNNTLKNLAYATYAENAQEYQKIKKQQEQAESL